MGAFFGCCVVAFAVWFGLRRVANMLDSIMATVVMIANEKALRAGEPPLVTDDVRAELEREII